MWLRMENSNRSYAHNVLGTRRLLLPKKKKKREKKKVNIPKLKKLHYFTAAAITLQSHEWQLQHQSDMYQFGNSIIIIIKK